MLRKLEPGKGRAGILHRLKSGYDYVLRLIKSLVCPLSKVCLLQTLKKLSQEKNRALKAISKQVKTKSLENRELDRQLRELQVSVAERAQIEKLAGMADSERCAYDMGVAMCMLVLASRTGSVLPVPGLLLQHLLLRSLWL